METTAFNMPNRKIINQIVERILWVMTPDKIILFGSQASGNARRDSDYDILIIKDHIENYRLTLKNLYKQMIGIEVGVDIILKTSDDIAKSNHRLVSITKEALDKGIVIYE